MRDKGGPSTARRQYHKQQGRRSKAEADEIADIEQALAEGAPPRGSNPLAAAAAAGSEAPPGLAAAKKFEDLPISGYSKQGLRDAKYITLTAVQRAALPHALCGRDVLGAAKTGSGKTLAFLLPALEALYRQRWSRLDGLGALIISPTRELALQIFDELRKIGRRHELSAGLLIGGKDVKEEKARVHGMNILVCTPGRLLQHMDETPGFDASQLQVLVLDEADRNLDMGFSVTLDAIVSNLPRQRQTLLFSATQTKNVKDLARLSLKDPEYVSVHAEAAAPTPVKLQQAYMECELPQKLDILWSFIKTHLKIKTIIFASTCKQVRFLFEAFRKLRPGVPLRALHGKMNQYKRMGVFYEFCEAKAMVLFATDIAARGLDFPTVDWVVQADCPEDVAAYIHRVGRTARYVSAGKGLLLLLPSEREGMLAQLEEAKVPVKQLKHNPAKVQPVTPALQALLSKDAELKEVAQRALVSYLRSVFLQPNRKVFDVTQLPAAEFAYSMGLPTAPKLRFLKKAGKKMQEVVVGSAAGGADEAAEKQQQQQQRGNQATGSGDNRDEASSSDGEEEESGGEREGAEAPRRQAAPAAILTAAAGSDDDDDFLVVKQRHVAEEDDEEDGAAGAAGGDAASADAADAGGRKRKKKLRIKSHSGTGTRVVFDDEGEAVDPLELLARDGGQFQGDDGKSTRGTASRSGLDTGIHGSVADRAAAARAVMLQRDRKDKEELQEMRKAKRQEKRAKRLAREAEGAVATLGGGGGSEEEEEGSESEGGYSSGEEGPRRGWRGDGRGGGAAAAAKSDSEAEAGPGSELDVDLLDSSDDEEAGAAQRGQQQQQRQQRKRPRGAAPEVAHFGMLPAKPAAAPAATAAPEGRGGGEAEQRKKKMKGADASGMSGMSLAQQEALALKLLQGRNMKEGNNNLGLVGAALIQGAALVCGARAFVYGAQELAKPVSKLVDAALKLANAHDKLGDAAGGINSSLDRRNGGTVATEDLAVQAVVPQPFPPASPKHRDALPVCGAVHTTSDACSGGASR
ncbi:DEAD-box ATP-dependent RNA helicase 32 [Micractinium conductrix]|uniref:ATP-dependent RNA helicase n=1 Tax=Micractinium conductrix TaxID=554055 RepID=A0A2P6VG13_9CHLO|nr:DEAD-box ATP-dependent RNA helicase 32 [Micractinium conductrix]|eukprot:PSC73011.1 DEAD-box ATP-dependent RNA helicase 32 [Micractinium conductrix]